MMSVGFMERVEDEGQNPTSVEGMVGRVSGVRQLPDGETRHRMKIIEINNVGRPGRRPTYKELGPTGK